LGNSFSIFPKPVAEHGLRTNGIYGLVRHPMYAGLIGAGFGLGLATGNPVLWGPTVLLLVFFDFKARYEETMLAELHVD